MTSRALLVLAVAAGAAFVSCADPFDPSAEVTAPDSVHAEALGMHAVRVTWAHTSNAKGYTLERRANLTGQFATVKEFPSGFTVQYVDDSLTPETIYGYRLVTTSLTGIRSAPSLIAGTRTAPVPGVVASVATSPSQLADPKGYTVAIARAGDTLRALLGPQDKYRFSPLPVGTYKVWISGVPPNCAVAGGPMQTDTVTDQGMETLQYASFNVSCRDPHVGRLSVHVTTTGDSLDADGYELVVSGVADDATLPDSQRAYFRRQSVTVNALQNYESLRPGNYTIELSGIAGNCTVQGATSRAFRVNALDDLAQTFTVTCQQAEDPTRPLVWRSTWSKPAPAQGEKISLEVSLDMRAVPGQNVSAVQANLGYDQAVLRFDSTVALPPWQKNANGTSGVVTWLAFVNGAGRTDSVSFIRFHFTVVGGSGSTTTTRTTFTSVTNQAEEDLTGLIRRVEGTVTVGSGTPTNQPPVSRPGGPYNGTAGVPVSMNGSTSSDPDGSLTGWSWTFGDGGTATGMSPTHTYAAAGTYTVTLTVTDNGGTTGSATTSATIAPGGGGGNQAPTALVNGPYNGVIGTPVAFSAAGSSDPDGTIASYAWDFGDGGTATGLTPTHTYATAAAFTVTLTVTDNLGATGSTTTTATIVPGGAPKPFTWRSEFGPVSPTDSLVTLTVTVDLSTNIPETPVVEALSLWRVDSLKWDPTVLQFFAFNFGPEGAGSVNPTDALTHGKLLVGGIQGAFGSTGVVTIALIKFKVIGASGASTTTATSLGQLQGTVATGSFNYGPYTSVLEGALQAP